MKKISIKREQSQAGLSFAEREKFRPQVKNKLLLLLALLMTVATGAWADETLLTTITPTGTSTYSATTDDVVDVQIVGMATFAFGCWIGSDGGSITITPKDGYNISKCVFKLTTVSLSTTVSNSPFVINCSGGSFTGLGNIAIDAIEVYGTAPSTKHLITATYFEKTRSLEQPLPYATTIGELYEAVTGESFGDLISDMTALEKPLTEISSGNTSVVSIGEFNDANTPVTVTADGEATVAINFSGYNRGIHVIVVPPLYVTMADGTADAYNWTATVGTSTNAKALPIGGLKGDGSETVTLKYNGRLKVKGVKATSDAPAKEPVTLATPLTIEAITPGTIVVDIDGTLSKGMKYSVNGGTKTLITTTKSIEGLKAGDKVQFYGNGTQTQVYGGYTEVSILGIGDGFKTKVYGNIMSLLDEEGFATKTDLPNAQNVFYGLFKGNTTLNDASELLLPATTLAERCYFGMFTGCTSLTTAPKLPATTLAYQCYYSMFLSCTSLTNAYVKAAFTAGNAECNGMFEDCSAAGAVLHTTPGNKASWEAKMGSGKDWENWSVADDWQE